MGVGRIVAIVVGWGVAVDAQQATARQLLRSRFEESIKYTVVSLVDSYCSGARLIAVYPFDRRKTLTAKTLPLWDTAFASYPIRYSLNGYCGGPPQVSFGPKGGFPT